ncbi:hypothetical protein L210DRAFT_3648007 [Boletus edulis BED1]|uniref:C2H2-type domain-containing protein n=1 Tax=Boletus edulis BED1 TaxID=1328754 RepID=A0AAD4GCH7_BOLED|nr:hypothetical protein L210DRAFT_3648007 [Boletus edulis BED1]
MPETFPCTFADCGQVFSKAYELKKHKATHDDPDSVHHCPNCDFITLQKKSLAIHVANHTGEKNLECPEMVTVGNSERRCDYKTHDPAALSKHRKKVHAHVPQSNRSRPKALPPSPRKTRQKKEEKAPRRLRRSKRIAASPRHKASRSPRKPRSPKKDRGNTSTSANRTRVLPLEGVSRSAVVVEYRYGCFDCDSSTTLVGSDDEMGLDTLFDPSLRCQWMARYEMGYSTFGTTGMKYEPAPFPESSALDLAPDVRTDREGCLCPEWMVEAGVEGWV